MKGIERIIQRHPIKFGAALITVHVTALVGQLICQPNVALGITTLIRWMY
jgi:hypothetical protein